MREDDPEMEDRTGSAELKPLIGMLELSSDEIDDDGRGRIDEVGSVGAVPDDPDVANDEFDTGYGADVENTREEVPVTLVISVLEMGEVNGPPVDVQFSNEVLEDNVTGSEEVGLVSLSASVELVADVAFGKGAELSGTEVDRLKDAVLRMTELYVENAEDETKLIEVPLSEGIPVDGPLGKVVLLNGAEDVVDRNGETLSVGSVVVFKIGVIVELREELRDKFPGSVGKAELLDELLPDSASVALVPDTGAESVVDDTGSIVKFPLTLVPGTVGLTGSAEETVELSLVEVENMEDSFAGIDSVEVPLSVPVGGPELTNSVDVNRLDVFEGKAVVREPRLVLPVVVLGRMIVGNVSSGAELVFAGKGAEVGMLSTTDDKLEVKLEPYASAEEVARNDVKLTSCVSEWRISISMHCLA